MNSNSCICKCIWDHSHCVNTWHTAYINCSTQTSKHCRVIMNLYINATYLKYVMSNISSWGIRHETTAKEKYIESESSKHLSFGVTPTGFYICITWWEGVLWLLWLWVLGDQMSLLGTRQDTVRTVKKRDFCLVGSSPSDGTLKLDRKQLLLSSTVPASCYTITILWFLCVDTYRITHWENNPRCKFRKLCYKDNKVF